MKHISGEECSGGLEKGAVFMTTVCTCGFSFESVVLSLLPDRALVVRAVSRVLVLGVHGAELAQALTALAVALLGSESPASLDPVISWGLQCFWGQHLCAG